MMDFAAACRLLADAPAPAGEPSPLLPFVQYAPLVLLLVLFYFLVFGPQRREQQRRQQMLDGLKKDDRVATVGGIVGTIANLTPDGKFVMLKVDDHVKLRMLRSSIQTVLDADPEAGTGGSGAGGSS